MEIDGRDVGDAGGIVGGEENQVPREGLVGLASDDVAHADVLPILGGELSEWEEDGGGAVVLEDVGAMALQVLVAILQRGEDEDDAKGDKGSLAAEDGGLGDLVQASKEEEVDVGDTAELFKEISRNERDDVIFGGADGVAGGAVVLSGCPIGVGDEDEADIGGESGGLGVGLWRALEEESETMGEDGEVERNSRGKQPRTRMMARRWEAEAAKILLALFYDFMTSTGRRDKLEMLMLVRLLVALRVPSWEGKRAGRRTARGVST